MKTVNTRGPGYGWENGLTGGARVWMPLFNTVGFFAMFAIGALAAGLQTLWQDKKHLLFDALVIVGFAVIIWSIGTYFPRELRTATAIWAFPMAIPGSRWGSGLMLRACPLHVSWSAA